MTLRNGDDPLLVREWLVTNGLGGYASGTVSGVITRRYQGLLIAALPNPRGRVVMLNYLGETLVFPDSEEVQLTGEEFTSCDLQVRGACYLTDFYREMGIPVWQYQLKGYTIEKRLFLRYQQNTVQVEYRVLSGQEGVRLRLRPAVHFRSHQLPVSVPLSELYSLTIVEDRYEITDDGKELALRMELIGEKPSFIVDRKKTEEFVYRSEETRGYEYRGRLWTPGCFEVELALGGGAVLIASTEPWETIRTLTPDEARDSELERRRLLLGAPREEGQTARSTLALAADQFLIVPVSRRNDLVRVNAAGDTARSVIAGYHWFTDWGRDTMISLEGLTLVTGRYSEAAWILRTFSRYIRDGLIPNNFPEMASEGRYNTADATL